MSTMEPDADIVVSEQRPRGDTVPARSILTAIALSGWLIASLVAFFLVSYTGFFGVAFVGLVICYVSAQFELDADRPVGSSLSTSFLGAQLWAQQQLTEEQRKSVRHDQSLAAQSARFFKHLGLGLMVVGLGGGVYHQL
jgi:hypothetical protein